MGSVYVYPPLESDFSTHGLGRLTPLEATVSETAGGMFALTVTHPMDEAGRWRWLREDCVLKAPVPTRESPFYEDVEQRAQRETVTREVYIVNTHCVHLRAGAGVGTKILGYCPRGTEVVRLGQSGGWTRVSLAQGGRSGWIYSRYLTFSRAVEEVLSPVGVERSPALSPKRAEDQLFRVYEVEQDTAEGCVTARAMHISYDLRGNLVNGDYAPEKAAPAEVLAQISARLLYPTDFSLRAAAGLTGSVTADYGFKNVTECLLDPEQGVAAQAGALVVRDNFDIFFLPDAPRDSGVTIRRRKNLQGARATRDAADVVTRILPVGRDAAGEALYLSDDAAQRWVDSPRAASKPWPMAERRGYDVRLTARASEADGESVFPDTAAGLQAARARLRALAEADFAAGADEADYGLEVDFILLQDAEEYAGYAALQSVYLHDTVRVIDEPAGLDVRARVTGYTWDALAGQYTSVRLGRTAADQRRVYGYNLPTAGIPGSKIAPGTADGEILRPGSVGYERLSAEAVGRLSSGTLTGLEARLAAMLAGTEAEDDLFRALAALSDRRAQAALDGLELGGRQLMARTAELPTGTGSGVWRVSDGVARSPVGGDFYGLTLYNATGQSSYSTRWINSPTARLEPGWAGRRLTFSAFAWSEDWTAVERAAYLYLALNQGGTGRMNYTASRAIHRTDAAQWGPQMNAAPLPPAGGQWRRFSVTFELTEANFPNGTGTFAANTHCFVSINLPQGGDVRFYAPKLEWGGKATDWSPLAAEADTGV